MKKDHNHELNRRSFIRQSTCAALGMTGVVDALAHLTLMNSVVAQTTVSTPYQALVVIFLMGGNDGNNTLIPQHNHPEYANYKTGRGILGILDPTDTPNGNPTSLPLGSDGMYGVHYNLGPLQSLYNSGKLAFVANVGTLCQPLPRGSLDYATVPLPPQLFSHADQSVQWQSSISDQPFKNGWGGRIADLLRTTSSGTVIDPTVSMCISMTGTNKLQVGNITQQYCVTPEGVVGLNGGYSNSSGPYGGAQNADGSYKTGFNAGRRLQAFDELWKYTYAHLAEQSYNGVVKQARNCELTVNAAVASATAMNINFDALMDTTQFGPDGLMGQLKMVAKLMAGRSSLIGSAVQRQIFFCGVSGYDTHQNQLGSHANLMTELGQALSAFNTILGPSYLNLSNNVLTLTHSDFTRTLNPNGSVASTTGSDHGWGGHQIVMGGPVIGGQVYGQFPSLAIGGVQDTPFAHNRGRWIPTTSVDQYMAVAADWFGVSRTNLQNVIFPNLTRFNDPFTSSSANLLFLNGPPTW